MMTDSIALTFVFRYMASSQRTYCNDHTTDKINVTSCYSGDVSLLSVTSYFSEARVEDSERTF